MGGMDGNNAFGEDMLQMALKMATEYEDQPVDLESAMTANTITPSSHPGLPGIINFKGHGPFNLHCLVISVLNGMCLNFRWAGSHIINPIFFFSVQVNTC